MTDRPGVAIVHYHLRTGGVRRVVEHILSSMPQRGFRCVVLSGEEPIGRVDSPAPVRVVPGLAYRRTAPPGPADRLLRRLKREAASALGSPPDLWHFHNHSLGKNPAVPLLVRSLADEGNRLLLQIHDFAEDARPGNYAMLADRLADGDPDRLGALLYPAADHVHYGVLNSRDRDFLTRSGAPASNVHLLPNAVTVDEDPGGPPDRGGESARFFLYPTRAIRRKNLGELLLWAAVDGGESRFGVTLAPRNPAARPTYHRWVEFSRSLDLPVEFELGARSDCSLAGLLRRSDAVVSTSVAEGFGMCFLEPWLVGRSLTGRDLPDVTRDFRAAGVDLPGLYRRLEVPVDWVGTEELLSRLRTALSNYRGRYGRETDEEHVRRAWRAFVTDDRVDVGRLDEPLQEKVIRRLAADAPARAEVRPRRLDGRHASSESIERNMKAVAGSFNLDAYGDRLEKCYREALQSPRAECATGALSGKALLEKFLDPARFCLLRTD